MVVENILQFLMTLCSFFYEFNVLLLFISSRLQLFYCFSVVVSNSAVILFSRISQKTCFLVQNDLLCVDRSRCKNLSTHSLAQSIEFILQFYVPCDRKSRCFNCIFTYFYCLTPLINFLIYVFLIFLSACIQELIWFLHL